MTIKTTQKNPKKLPETEFIKSAFLKAVFPSLLLTALLKIFVPTAIDFNPIISSPVLFTAVATILFTLGYLGYKKIKPEFAKSNLHNNKTYLDFVICILACLFLIFAIDVSTTKVHEVKLSCIFSAIFLIISTFGIILKRCTKPLLVTTLKRRFAPEASNDDNLNFTKSAREAATAIKSSEKYVSVVALNGGYGEGKSSYARMIIESIGIKKSLYSYISLTETNATKDFSKLFAERWFETLNERYPTINIAPYVASLEAILRESTNNSALVSAISQILVKLNFGLSKTVAKCWDLNALKKENRKEIFVPNSTAAMFNHIPKIKEDVWIINIDEIERAQLDEIYRVIEVIERFKHEGRFGLPVKLVFLLCVSGSDLQKRLEDLKKIGNEKAQLIEDFFFNNPKSRDQNLFLPPISYEKKKEFVVNSLNKVLTNTSLKIDSINIVNITKPTASPETSFLKKADALSFIVEELIKAAPRVTLKVCQELEFFYHHFKDSEGNYAANKLALCDAIGINFIKMEFPWLIADIKVALEAGNSIFIKRSKKDFDDEESYLLAKNLLEIVYNSRFEIPNQLEEKAFEERSSNPELMRMVLRGFFDQSKLNEVVEDNFIYKTYSAENHSEALKGLSANQLKEYGKIDNLPTNNLKNSKRLEIIDELINRPPLLRADNIDRNDTSSDNFLSLFERNLEQAAKEVREDKKDEDSKNILSRVKNFLQCEQVLTSAKYQFLSHYIETASNFRNMLTLKYLFKKEEVKEVFKDVFVEAAERYFKGDNSKSIYQKEEMPKEVLYNSWNGKKESSQNIQRLNQAALRDLENHPKLILEYLKNYISCISNPGTAKFEYVTQDQLKTLVSATEDSELKEYFEKLSKIQKGIKSGNTNILDEYINSKTRVILNEKLCCFNDFPKNNANQPLMMAMIEQGYIDEKVSLFEFDSKAKNSL